METQKTLKKVWTKPVVQALNIKKDTFGGSVPGAEAAGKAGPAKKKA
jgi:hypothetical protein